MDCARGDHRISIVISMFAFLGAHHLVHMDCHATLLWGASGFYNYFAVGSNPRRQSKNIEMKYKTHTKLVHELCDTCFQYNVKD